MAKVEEAELASQAESSSKSSLNPNKSILSKYRFGNFHLQGLSLFVLRQNISFFCPLKSSEREPAAWADVLLGSDQLIAHIELETSRRDLPTFSASNSCTVLEAS